MKLELKDINKSFGNKQIYEKFNLTLNSGQTVCLAGRSGRGKSTLLNLISLYEPLDSGEIKIDNVNIGERSFNRKRYWRYTLNYLFQNGALIEDETVLKNLVLALKYTKLSKNERLKLIAETLESVGLPDYENKRIYQLSGGEQKRIALTKLLIKPAELIIVDEPTESLDSYNKEKVMESLETIKALNKIMIIATHDENLYDFCDYTIQL